MAEKDTKPGMAATPGFVQSRPAWNNGPTAIGALVPQVTRPAFKKHNPAAALVLADWEIIVGPKLAAITSPRRLDRGILTIACAGPVAMSLHYEGVELINRINTHLGGQPVHSLRFTQAGIPRKPAPGRPAPPEAATEANAAVAELPDGELKSALAALGRVVIGRSKHSTRRVRKL
jgi:hypothetical protein